MQLFHRRTSPSQPRLNPFCQGTEVGNTLQFVIRQLHMEVVLEPSQQIERLQAIDTQRLEKVVVWTKLFAGDLEVLGRQIQNLVECLLLRFHNASEVSLVVPVMANTAARPRSPQI